MNPPLDHPAVADYYRLAAEPLTRQLSGRVVHAAGWDADHAGRRSALDTTAALLAEVAADARWFSWELDADTPGVVQIGFGEGADVSTAATAALAVVEELQTLGRPAVPATDGQGALLVLVSGVADLMQLIEGLSERAPEIATVDAESADGRAWLAVAGPGTLVPAPYSLVDSADGTGAVFPLAVDELAAVTAGMPLEPTPDDLVDRLSLYGDLAAVLAT